MGLVEEMEAKPIWDAAVGRLVLASGALEYHVLQAIFYLSDESQAKRASRMTQSNRLTLLESLMQTDDSKQNASGFIQLLRDFNGERNHVAHNGLMYWLGENGDEYKGSIVNIRNPDKRISLDEVRALADKGEGLAKAFWLAWVSVGGKLPGMPK